MSGPVAEGHSKVEARCESCHAPFGGASAARCTSCHAVQVTLRVHEAIAGGCGQCHQEHRGRANQLVQNDVSACRSCHRDSLAPGKHPPTTHTECFFCHRHHATPIFARSVTTDLVFPHRVHVESPGLVQAPCESCHRLTPDGALRELPKESVCRTCHFGYKHDVAKSPRQSECRLCHDPDRPVTITRSAGHTALSFTHEAHQAFSCLECHQEIEPSMTTVVPLPRVPACVRCHEGSDKRRAEKMNAHARVE